MHTFDKNYWEEHWKPGTSRGQHTAPPHPYVIDETRGLPRGRALDAGCGAGTEAIWLASQGWEVTGADISGTVLETAAARGREAGVTEPMTWVETDLSTWDPQDQWDLVLTSYAHPTIPQLEFYRRIADWVAPGGTLLIVGHLHSPAHGEHEGHGGHGEHDRDAEHPPHEATATLTGITGLFDAATWRIGTAGEHTRTLGSPDGHQKQLHDVVVRATRRG